MHVLHHVVLFGMNQQHGIGFSDPGHQIAKVPGADHAGHVTGRRRTDIGGENLEGGKAILHRLVNRVDHLGGNVAQEHQMVGVVGIGIALPDIGPLGDGPGNIPAGIQDREVQQSGGAAEQGGAADLLGRSGEKIAPTDDGSRDMSVRFDAAGHHHHPGGVDNPSGLASQNARRGHGHYLFSPDRHVPHPDTGGGDHRPARNDQVQHSGSNPFGPAEEKTSRRANIAGHSTEM